MYLHFPEKLIGAKQSFEKKQPEGFSAARDIGFGFKAWGLGFRV